MKTIALSVLLALSYVASIETSTASAGDIDKWIRMGLSTANNGRTVAKLNGRTNPLNRAALNPQPLPPKLFLRRR